MALLKYSVRIAAILLYLLFVDVGAREKVDGETEKESISEFRSQKKVKFIVFYTAFVLYKPYLYRV